MSSMAPRRPSSRNQGGNAPQTRQRFVGYLDPKTNRVYMHQHRHGRTIRERIVDSLANWWEDQVHSFWSGVFRLGRAVAVVLLVLGGIFLFAYLAPALFALL